MAMWISFWQAHFVLFLVFVFVLTLMIGSFLNVVILRFPIMMMREWRQQCEEFLTELAQKTTDYPEQYNLVFPASHCPSCRHPIRPWHNIPVLSYLFLAGQCAHCQGKISLRYPLIESLCAIASVLVVWHFGFSLQAVMAVLFTWLLLVMSCIDIDHQLIPDDMSYIVLWLGLSCNLWGVFTSLHAAVIGALAGYLSLWVIATVFELFTGRQGMGHGDFKLLAALGAWFGWELLLPTVLIASLLGAGIGLTVLTVREQSRRTPIPFGPFLALAGWVNLLWGGNIIRWYLPLVT